MQVESIGFEYFGTHIAREYPEGFSGADSIPCGRCRRGLCKRAARDRGIVHDTATVRV